MNQFNIKKAEKFIPLITGELGEELPLFLKKRDYKSALDIGFFSPATLFLLYHNFGIRRLKGIDKDEKLFLFSDILNNLNEGEVEKHEEFTSWFDMYNQIMKSWDGNEVFPKIQTESHFEKTFDLCCGVRQLGFFQSNSENFDIIISSNVLHYEPKKDVVIQILKGIKKSLNPGGLIYIRIKQKPSFLEGKNRSSFYNFKFEYYSEIILEILGSRISIIKHKPNHEGIAITYTNIPYLLG